MTIKEKLALMDDIRRKNDASWSKYTSRHRPGPTCTAKPSQPRFPPFSGVILPTVFAGCMAVLLALVVYAA